jgi:hypothetical protein
MTKARDLASASIVPAAVSVTELGYIDGVTSAIQTQMDTKAATAATINPTIVDAKGDLIAATAADTVSRLAVGANDTVLTADSTTATGLKWAAAAGGGMTLLSTTTLTGASTSVSITPTGYNKIFIQVTGVTNGSNGNLFMGINTDTTAGNYVQAFYATEGTALYTGANVGIAGVNAIIPGQAGYLGTSANNIAQFEIVAPNGTTRKLVTASSAFFSGSSLNAASNSTCNYVTTSAISSVQMKTTVGSFTAGTVLVYGVK